MLIGVGYGIPPTSNFPPDPPVRKKENKNIQHFLHNFLQYLLILMDDDWGIIIKLCCIAHFSITYLSTDKVHKTFSIKIKSTFACKLFYPTNTQNSTLFTLKKMESIIIIMQSSIWTSTSMLSIIIPML